MKQTLEQQIEELKGWISSAEDGYPMTPISVIGGWKRKINKLKKEKIKIEEAKNKNKKKKWKDLNV